MFNSLTHFSALFVHRAQIALIMPDFAIGERKTLADRRDSDPVIVYGACLGTASHESYRHTHAHLSFYARAT